MPFQDLLKEILEPQKLITAFGLIGILCVIFAESGLFFGFFLPGDSLVFTAGFIASQGHLPIIPLLIGSFIAAVAGDNVGYWFGKKTGPKIFSKEDSRFFKKKYITEAQEFFEKHGKKTIILARFVPIVRTFAPILAGVGNMRYRIFMTYNIIGGFVWTFGLTLFGYFLGKAIPDADHYLFPIIIIIILVSFLPGILHFYKNKNKSSE